jgi:hypothetical protein
MSAAAPSVMAAYAVCAQVFQSSAERPFAINLLENNIWLEGQVNVPLTTSCVLLERISLSHARATRRRGHCYGSDTSRLSQATCAKFAAWLNGPHVLHLFV